MHLQAGSPASCAGGASAGRGLDCEASKREQRAGTAPAGLRPARGMRPTPCGPVEEKGHGGSGVGVRRGQRKGPRRLADIRHAAPGPPVGRQSQGQHRLPHG